MLKNMCTTFMNGPLNRLLILIDFTINFLLFLVIGKENDLMYVNGYDHPNILSGAGTMGLEIIEQVPDVEAVVIPVGGGGLIAGCAVALKTMKPNIKIIVSLNIVLYSI